MPSARSGTFFCGMLTMTRSASAAASLAHTAVAPVSFARSASVSGEREFATFTSWPSSRSRRTSVPPIWPAPMIPILMQRLRVVFPDPVGSTPGLRPPFRVYLGPHVSDVVADEGRSVSVVGEAAALPLAISGPAGRPGALIGHLTVVRDDA